MLLVRLLLLFFLLMIRRPPRSTLFPYTTSSDLVSPETPFRIASISKPFTATLAAVNGFEIDRKSTRLNSSHRCISYAVFCLKKKNDIIYQTKKHGHVLEPIRT